MGMKKLFASLSFTAAIALFFVGCGKEETTTGGGGGGKQESPISGVTEHKMEDGTIHVLPNNKMSSLISQGKYDTIKKEFCGDNGCSDELKTFSDKPTVSLVVTLTNTMILFQRLDKALTTICGFVGSSIPQICGSQSAPGHQASRISGKQTDIVDTVLNLVGLNRNEITNLMTEIATATENYIKIPDSKNYVFAITVPFQVKVGNLVDVWFKAGTQIRWDLMNVLGGVSQLVLAGFNVINSHDLVLDIGAILSNANQLLSDLQGDPAGFIVRLPGTLGLDGAPNFLRFKQGGADIWKQIPTNFSKAFSWSGQGLEYMFGNPCKDNEPALVCYKDAKLRFNLDLQKNNKFLGEKATGELPLPGGFTSETAQNVVKILKNGGEKFDCSKDDNAIHISEGPDKFDVSKIVNTVGSFIANSITEIPLPNFMKIDVCRFFGAEGSQPKPIRDLLFPHELVQDGKEYKTANAGKFFAVEVEASRNFFLKAITLGNNQDNPIYLGRWTNYGDLVIVTNLFTNPPHSLVPQLPYLKPAWVRFVSGLTTISYVETTTTIPITPEGSTIPIPVTFSYIIPTTNQFEGIQIERGFGDFKNFAPLLDPTNSGLPENTIGLLVSKNWVKGDYVARGDGKRFKKVKDQNGNSLEISQDYLDPLTSFISLRWHSQYPQDVVSSLSAILDDIGMKFLIYVLFKDPSWNNSVQIDICSVLYAFANSAKQKYDAATDSMKKSAIANIVKAVYDLQKSRKDQHWNCSVINIATENPFSFTVSQVQADWKGSTNQIANDLLGLGLFAIAALGVE
jgi:hypothetical protein